MSLTTEHVLAVVKNTLQSAEFCFLIDVNTEGRANARLMEPFPPEDDLTLWFGTHPKSRKIEELKRDNHLTVAYQFPDELAYITLFGTGEIVRDEILRRQYWREGWESFFPGGPGGDHYVLIRFVPARIEIVNHKRQIFAQPEKGIQVPTLVKQDGEWVLEGAPIS